MHAVKSLSEYRRGLSRFCAVRGAKWDCPPLRDGSRIGSSSLTLSAVFWDAQLTRWVVWVGLIALTVALLLLIRTRWGQSKPLGKCVVLSLLAHLLLGIYTTTVDIVTSTVGSPDGQGIQVALVAGEQPTALDPATAPREPWSSAAGSLAGEALGAVDLAPVAGLPELPTTAEPARRAPPDLAAVPAAVAPSTPVSEDAGPPTFAPEATPIAQPAMARPEPVELPKSSEGENLNLVPPPDQPKPAPAETSDRSATGGKPDATADTSAPDSPARPAGKQTGKPESQAAGDGGADRLKGPTPSGSGQGKPLPNALVQRVGDHVAKGRGATPETEAAVTAALAWLAANQRASGRWDARGLGGGAGRAADGEERSAAGSQADAGLTGLALLAFLAAGHTHLQGPHQTTVRRGLEYLLGMQDGEGCLAGTTHRYERMYCHAMATCALSEAFAMTGDQRLQPAVRRAIGYTLRSQDRATGGWRYMPGDPGDTSQLGWQLMALKSAELAGIPIPQEAREGMARFLRSVAAGQSRGLACYQPTRPIPTRSMTAEALVCRQFIGLVDGPQTSSEASGFLLQELPGAATTNHYYWYYATLGLYQVQGDAWHRWNAALQKNLLGAQRRDGALAGSWDPDPVWGPCGGRVYSTALATLCLEVYYRFLPLYVEAAGRERRTK